MFLICNIVAFRRIARKHLPRPSFAPGKFRLRGVCPPICLMIRPPNNRSAKQKALICAATTLFARFGYEATTTREIAARAGCAEGLIHRYFGGKSGLLFSLVKLHLAQESAVPIERPACATLEAEMQNLMDWQLDQLWKEREFLCLAFSCGILQPRLGNLLRTYMPARTALVVQRIRSYTPSHCSNEDIEMLAHALISLGFEFGFIRPAILRQNRQQTRHLARRAAKLLSRSLLTR
jgi:AcrR family transcriptional regulator